MNEKFKLLKVSDLNAALPRVEIKQDEPVSCALKSASRLEQSKVNSLFTTHLGDPTSDHASQAWLSSWGGQTWVSSLKLTPLSVPLAQQEISQAEAVYAGNAESCSPSRNWKFMMRVGHHVHLVFGGWLAMGTR